MDIIGNVVDRLSHMTREHLQSETHDLIRRRLSEHGHRYTKGRRSVVAAVQLSTGPRTAAEITTQCASSVPISSMYRTLSILDESSVLRKHYDAEGVARYELAEWLTDHHHHVICVSCGRIEDVALDDTHEVAIGDIATYLGDRTGFRALDHVLEVEGVCGDCDQAAAVAEN